MNRDRGLLDLSARKVYPPSRLHGAVVGSYPTFSPLPGFRQGGYFLWHCLFPNRFGTRPLGGAALCAVRTFLAACATRQPRFVVFSISKLLRLRRIRSVDSWHRESQSPARRRPIFFRSLFSVCLCQRRARRAMFFVRP
jgi:hypothetical protein